MLRPRKIAELIITAFTEPERTGTGEPFPFLVNPESLKTSHQNQFSRKRGINTSGRNADYALSLSKEMSLQLTIDKTIVQDKLPGIARPSSASVKDQVDRFMKYCFEMDGQIHQPRYLLIEWGKFSFKCRLKSVNISYALTDADGEPLRATLDAVFVEDMSDSMRLREEKKQSPDITHVRTILQGQTITGLCKAIYGDASHYIMVAKANQLDHFRSLEPGTKLYFPPLKQNN